MIDPLEKNKKVKDTLLKFDSMLDQGEYDEVCLFFSGKGLKALHETDEMTKISFESLSGRFDLKMNSVDELAGIRNLYLQEQIFYFASKFFA